MKVTGVHVVPSVLVSTTNGSPATNPSAFRPKTSFGEVKAVVSIPEMIKFRADVDEKNMLSPPLAPE